MRLNTHQVDAIKQATAEIFGESAEVWLFGSRTDDGKRGGDIDLLVRLSERSSGQPSGGGEPALMKKIRLLGALEKRLGERKIDVIIERPGDTRPIVRIAHEEGVRLT